jgi:roadblock/LC7 domain-containing protein
MEPIALIVTALAAGASSGVIEGLAGTVKENANAAFAKLLKLTRRRFKGNASAEVILSEHQNDPAAYEAPLAKKLAGAGAADDTELLAAAMALMELLDQSGANSGKYNVTIKGSKGVQVGDGNSQFNKF